MQCLFMRWKYGFEDTQWNHLDLLLFSAFGNVQCQWGTGLSQALTFFCGAMIYARYTCARVLCTEDSWATDEHWMLFLDMYVYYISAEMNFSNSWIIHEQIIQWELLNWTRDRIKNASVVLGRGRQRLRLGLEYIVCKISKLKPNRKLLAFWV